MELVKDRLAAILLRNWWVLLVRGIVAIVSGVLAWLQPGISLAALVLLFGAYSMADGILGAWTAVAGRREHEHWWVLLLEGLVGHRRRVPDPLRPRRHRARAALLHRDLGHRHGRSRDRGGDPAPEGDRGGVAARPRRARLRRVRRAARGAARGRCPRRAVDHAPPTRSCLGPSS